MDIDSQYKYSSTITDGGAKKTDRCQFQLFVGFRYELPLFSQIGMW